MFSIVICHQSGDKWLCFLLMFLILIRLYSINVFDCPLSGVTLIEGYLHGIKTSGSRCCLTKKFTRQEAQCMLDHAGDQPEQLTLRLWLMQDSQRKISLLLDWKKAFSRAIWIHYDCSKTKSIRHQRLQEQYDRWKDNLLAQNLIHVRVICVAV